MYQFYIERLHYSRGVICPDLLRKIGNLRPELGIKLSKTVDAMNCDGTSEIKIYL